MKSINTVSNNFKFSVLLSVYEKEQSIFFEESLLSILNQSLQPSEIVLVVDGPIKLDLKNSIKQFEISFRKQNIAFKIIKLPEQVDLGRALAIGIQHCNYDWIARMDTDDISVKNRFKIQINYLRNHPNIAILGGFVAEFSDNNKKEINKVKKVPDYWDEIKRYSIYRNPFCHPTVIFNKQVILDVGNYSSCERFEDYWLWLRVISRHYRVANIDSVLVLMRVSDESYHRKSGWKNVKNIVRFRLKQIKLCYHPFLGFLCMISSVLLSLAPSKVQKSLYKNFLREKR